MSEEGFEGSEDMRNVETHPGGPEVEIESNQQEVEEDTRTIENDINTPLSPTSTIIMHDSPHHFSSTDSSFEMINLSPSLDIGGMNLGRRSSLPGIDTVSTRVEVEAEESPTSRRRNSIASQSGSPEIRRPDAFEEHKGADQDEEVEGDESFRCAGSESDSSPIRVGVNALAQLRLQQIDLLSTRSTASNKVSSRSISGGSGTSGRRKSNDGISSSAKSISRTALSPIPDLRDETILDPKAHAFEPSANQFNETSTFDDIIRDGKNAMNEWTHEARAALLKLGLRPIPSVHGPISLPYARCPSGIDSFIFTGEHGLNPWILDGSPPHNRPTRSFTVPLPGNARYAQARHLAAGHLPLSSDRRVVSSPADMERITLLREGRRVEKERLKVMRSEMFDANQQRYRDAGGQNVNRVNHHPPGWTPELMINVEDWTNYHPHRHLSHPRLLSTLSPNPSLWTPVDSLPMGRMVDSRSFIEGGRKVSTPQQWQPNSIESGMGCGYMTHQYPGSHSPSFTLPIQSDSPYQSSRAATPAVFSHIVSNPLVDPAIASFSRQAGELKAHDHAIGAMWQAEEGTKTSDEVHAADRGGFYFPAVRTSVPVSSTPIRRPPTASKHIKHRSSSHIDPNPSLSTRSDARRFSAAPDLLPHSYLSSYQSPDHSALLPSIHERTGRTTITRQPMNPPLSPIGTQHSTAGTLVPHPDRIQSRRTSTSSTSGRTKVKGQMEVDVRPNSTLPLSMPVTVFGPSRAGFVSPSSITRSPHSSTPVSSLVAKKKGHRHWNRKDQNVDPATGGVKTSASTLTGEKGKGRAA